MPRPASCEPPARCSVGPLIANGSTAARCTASQNAHQAHCPLDAQQAAIALAGLPERLRRVVVLGAYTGQRRGDLCALTWAAYDGATIRCTQQKTGIELVISVHPELRRELDAWKAQTTTLTILCNQFGRPWNGHIRQAPCRANCSALDYPRASTCTGCGKCSPARSRTTAPRRTRSRPERDIERLEWSPTTRDRRTSNNSIRTPFPCCRKLSRLQLRENAKVRR